MDVEEKMEVCRKLARSFRRADLEKDLIQEGLVAWLEHEAKGYTRIADLVLVSRKRMQDFISLRQSPVHIPPSDKTRDNARAIRKGQDAPLENMDPSTYYSLRTALEASTGILEGNEGSYMNEVEGRLWVQDVSEIMKDNLSTRHYLIYEMRYGPLELSQQEVANRLGMTDRAVRKAETKIKSILAMHSQKFL